MLPLRPIAVALVIATGACAVQDPALAPSAGAPAYVPANATPPMMTVASNEIVGPVWVWQRTQLADGKLVTPAMPDRYTLTFQGGSGMKLGAAALTKMGCPAGSQDMEFVAELARVASYGIVNNELTLTLADGGTMRFRAP